MASASRPRATSTVRCVGIVAALPIEARALGHARPRPDGLATLVDDALLAVSGMGAPAAAIGARALIAAGADALVSFGLAGGLDPALVPGTILIPREVMDADGACLTTDAAWRARLAEELDRYRPIPHGKLLTNPRALGSTTEKADTFRRTGAAAVDMESSGIAQAAVAHGLPFIVLRVIVDGASDVLPQALADSADAGGRLRWGHLLARLAVAPADVVALLRLAGRYAAARRSLRAAASCGVLTSLTRTP
jgi:hopanoid-associated phosphorylase